MSYKDEFQSNNADLQAILDTINTLPEAGTAGSAYLGENITGGSANDTVAFWVEKGPGYCWISETNQIVNQPTQYGFLISYANEGDAFQIFRDQTDGVTYCRSGDHINGWFQHWTMVYDESNLSPSAIGAVSTHCEHKESGDVTDLLGSKSARYIFTNDVTGMPFDGEWWFVDVLSNGSTDLTLTATSVTSDSKQYIRVCMNNTWSSWRQVLIANDEGIFVTESNIEAHYVQGEWLQTTANTHRSEPADKIAVLDGSGWVYHRTPDETRSDIGAAPAYTYGTTDLTAGTSELETGKLYFVYE